MRSVVRLLTCVVLLLLLLRGSAAAQGATWGVKGGVNLATLSASDFERADLAPDFNYRIGLVAGGFFTWPIVGLELQPEVLYSQEGATVGSQGIDAQIRLDYLRIPVLVRYRLSKSGNGLVVYGGPSLGIRLQAKSTASFGDTTTKTDISDDIKATDVGIAFGAGYEWGKLSIEGRYTFGISDIGAEADEPSKVRHRTIGILAGYRF